MGACVTLLCVLLPLILLTMIGETIIEMAENHKEFQRLAHVTKLTDVIVFNLFVLMARCGKFFTWMFSNTEKMIQYYITEIRWHWRKRQWR